MGWPESGDQQAVFEILALTFGFADITDDDVIDIANDLRAAIKNADIIGVPNEKQNEQSVHWANVMLYLERYRLSDNNTRFTGCNLHRQLQEENLFDRMIAATDQLYIVTCRDIGREASNCFQVPVIQIPIPEESRMHGRPTRHYPKRFGEMRKILAHPLKGKLVLVGAGLLGKIYCSWVKQAGGVAVDIGSIFDGWAGVVSRSYLRDSQKTYAL